MTVETQTLLVSTFAVVSDVISGMIAYAATTPPITDKFHITAQSELTFVGAPLLDFDVYYNHNLISEVLTQSPTKMVESQFSHLE